jgi:hypothetical protein
VVRSLAGWMLEPQARMLLLLLSFVWCDLGIVINSAQTVPAGQAQRCK